MNQNVYQISGMCQHKLVRRHEVFRFQRIYAKHLNVTNKIKQINVCNNSQHVLFNSMQDSNGLWYKFARTYYIVLYSTSKKVGPSLQNFKGFLHNNRVIWVFKFWKINLFFMFFKIGWINYETLHMGILLFKSHD